MSAARWASMTRVSRAPEPGGDSGTDVVDADRVQILDERGLGQTAGIVEVILDAAEHATLQQARNALLNICHYGGAYLVKESGCYASVICPFHSGSSDLNCRLVGQLDKAAFEGLETAGLGLVLMPCAEWYGLMFVNAQQGSEPVAAAAPFRQLCLRAGASARRCSAALPHSLQGAL